MHFTSDFIQSLKSKIPIELLIQMFIKLEKKGNTFVGLCPFHQDHQPSFTVFPDTQSFYCFGCQAGSKSNSFGSDHIAFLQQFNKISFQEAVILLADITNTPLPIPNSYNHVKDIHNNNSSLPNNNLHSDNTNLNSDNKKSSFIVTLTNEVKNQIFLFAAEFYHQNLFSEHAQKALNYLLSERNRSLNIIQQYKIGFAKGGNELYLFLKSKGFSDNQLLDSGIVALRNNQILDFFFGNIILFPHFITDPLTNQKYVQGFTICDPKLYKHPVNLRLFNRDHFFNQDALFNYDSVIIVEGENDLLSIIEFTNYNAGLTDDDIFVKKSKKHS
jgi:DNA primase